MATLRYLGNSKFTAIGGIYLDRMNRQVDIDMNNLHPLAEPRIKEALEAGLLEIVTPISTELSSGDEMTEVINADMSSATKPLISGIVESEEKFVKVRTKR